MISRHDEEIISEIADFNTLTLVTTAYTLYENLSTKKALSYELLPTAKGFIIWIYFVIQNQL